MRAIVKDVLPHRREEIVQPLRLRAFLEADVHRTAHPGEELQQRRFLGGSTLRAMILPLDSRTVADVVAWCTSSPTYFVEHLMRAVSCCGGRWVRIR
jgi:hypothetical protein